MSKQKSLLRKVRRDREITIAALAKKTGINASTLSLVERGVVVASSDVRSRLEKFFKIPADHLLADAPDDGPIILTNGHGNRAAFIPKERRKVNQPVAVDRRVSS